MKPERRPEVPQGVVRFYNFLAEGDPFLDAVLAGLGQPQKRIARGFFFDGRGAELFAAVCEQPECYLVRSETSILRENLAAIVQFIGPDAELIELRAGIGVQTAILAGELRPLVYVPVDIDGPMLESASRELAELFPWLNISGMRADFQAKLALPEFVGLPIRKKAVFLPGAALGSYSPDAALEVLRSARRLVGTGGVLLAGVDLNKNRRTIEAAYFDAQGLNSELHRNLLARINRELEGDFQPGRFTYHAFYDTSKSCVTMYLESRYSQIAHVRGRRFDFASGESIDTGFAFQYSQAEFEALARQAGFAPRSVWTDAAQIVSIHGMIALG